MKWRFTGNGRNNVSRMFAFENFDIFLSFGHFKGEKLKKFFFVKLQKFSHAYMSRLIREITTVVWILSSILAISLRGVKSFKKWIINTFPSIKSCLKLKLGSKVTLTLQIWYKERAPTKKEPTLRLSWFRPSNVLHPP